MREFCSRFMSYKELCLAVGGPLRADENRKSWRVRVARTAGIEVWQAKKAFYNEFAAPQNEVWWRLHEALNRKKQEARNERDLLIARIALLEGRLATQDQEFHSADIAALGGALDPSG